MHSLRLVCRSQEESCKMDERIKFISAVIEGKWSITTLCYQYGISRPTAYKWIERYKEYGPSGLEDQSRAPKNCPHKVSLATENLFIELRKKHPSWGASKLINWLKNNNKSYCDLPARSTVNEILDRHGLLIKKKKRMNKYKEVQPIPIAKQSNDIWCCDFKGDFKTLDGKRCYPLTITDSFSRFLLCCKGMKSTNGKDVKTIFTIVFKEFGLPKQILSDNGVPFSSVGDFSDLSIWWIKLGIIPIRIQKGKPYQNGKHERMHRTLKAETTKPPRKNIECQQRLFDHFINEYNFERPHEALDMKTPNDLYVPSSEKYDGILNEIVYPNHFDIRKVDIAGQIKIKQNPYHITRSLKREYIGLEPIDDGLWNVYFSFVKIGVIDEHEKTITKRKILRF